MICYESVVKNVVDVALLFFVFFFTIPIFLVVIGFSIIYIYICYKELIPQQLRKYCDNLL